MASISCSQPFWLQGLPLSSAIYNIYTFFVSYFSGVNTVTTLVESKKAQLVVIAHDVDPIEVCFSFLFVQN